MTIPPSAVMPRPTIIPERYIPLARELRAPPVVHQRDVTIDVTCAVDCHIPICVVDHALLSALIPKSFATSKTSAGCRVRDRGVVCRCLCSADISLTRGEALRCATHNNAFLTFDEDKKGSLEPGKLADLAVVSADPLTVEEARIRDINALMTMVGGRIVYERRNWFD